MLHYLVLVHEDGACATLHFHDRHECAEAFETATRKASVVYAHYATPLGDRINWYCRPED